MTSLSDSDPVVFELDLRSSEAQLELIEQDEQNVETLPQNAVDKVTEIPRGIAHEATKSEVENSINQIISADSDSADSASSLFKTQCPLDVSQNVRRRHCSGPSIPSGASVQNIRRSNEPSTDSDEEASPHHVQRYSLARRRMHNERRRWPPLTGRRRQLYPSASRKRYLKIRKNKGVPFTFLKDEVGVNELPHKMILMYEQAALWGFFSCVQKQKFDSCLQKQLEDLGSGKDLELREHSYADESESISPIEVEGEDINSSDDEERSDAKFVDKSFLLTENSKKRFHEEDARNIDAQQQSGNERIRRISTKTVPNPEEEGETHGHEKPFEEATQKRDSGAKVHPAVINNMDHDRDLSEKPKKKKKAKKTIDKNFSDQIQGEAIAANTVNNQGIFGSEEDIETQIEVPFHHNCEEIPDNVIHEGEKEEAASLSLINDEDSNNYLTEKSKKKKKKTSKKKIEKNVSNHVQSGTVLASGENDEAFDGTEADDETQIELPFHPTYEEITERLGSEGEKEVSLSLVSNVGSDNYLTEKSKKKKTSKKNINKNFSDQVQSGTVQASRVNEAFCGAEADDETEVELPFQHNYAEVPERLSSEGEKEVSLSHVSDVDSSNYLTKKSKKKKTNKKNIDKNRSNRVQSGTVLASGENDEAFDGTEADDETQIERHFHPTYEEVPERLNSEGGKEYSQSLISDVDSSNYVTKKSKKKKTSKKNIDKNVSNHVQSGTVMASGENDEAFDGTEADDETQIERPFHPTYEEVPERLNSEGGKEDSQSLISDEDNSCFTRTKRRKKKKKKKSEDDAIKEDVLIKSGMAHEVNGEHGHDMEEEACTQHNVSFLGKRKRNKKQDRNDDSKTTDSQKQSKREMAHKINYDLFSEVEWSEESLTENAVQQDHLETTKVMNQTSKIEEESSSGLISVMGMTHFLITEKAQKKKKKKKQKEERDDAWKPSSWIDATRKGMLSRDLSDGFENNEKFSCHSVGEEPFKELSHKERKRDGPSSEVHKGNVYVASDGGNKCISSDIHLLQKEGSSKSTSSESHHFLPPGGTNQTNISMYLGTKQKITKKRKLYTYQESDKFHLPALD
ncbi:uncharacterized protein LOC122787415 isoform X3 [Protopterus annectens]|uniref:uncharacterized protein LOC122787415 isoform X3 n=1 Tax=Protopterus annectens TaxID=7888 RepID=UPI001CFB3804|nr:uncharacterized protein LOC122787415 isoform X3 [Protopterus annectens]